MSYDITLCSPDGEGIVLLAAHEMVGEFGIDFSHECKMYITSNHEPHLQSALGYDNGIRGIDGQRVDAVLLKLRAAIHWLVDTQDVDSWLPTEGNTRRALIGLFALCEMVPSDSIVRVT